MIKRAGDVAPPTVGAAMLHCYRAECYWAPDGHRRCWFDCISFTDDVSNFFALIHFYRSPTDPTAASTDSRTGTHKRPSPSLLLFSPSPSHQSPTSIFPPMSPASNRPGRKIPPLSSLRARKEDATIPVTPGSSAFPPSSFRHSCFFPFANGSSRYRQKPDAIGRCGAE